MVHTEEELAKREVTLLSRDVDVKIELEVFATFYDAEKATQLLECRALQLLPDEEI